MNWEKEIFQFSWKLCGDEMHIAKRMDHYHNQYMKIRKYYPNIIKSCIWRLPIGWVHPYKIYLFFIFYN